MTNIRQWFNQLSPLILSLLIFTVAMAQMGTAEARKSKEDKQLIRGGIVFKNYCVLCHGDIGDGYSRASKLYGVASLVIQPNTTEYYEKMITLGGEAVGKSSYMPMWGDELSKEQIHDVAVYLKILGDKVLRGEAVYKQNCILCHGVNADGKGRAAKLYDPKPPNLRMSKHPIEYKEMIVRKGGGALGRSSIMPPWELQLTNQEIKDIVSYLKSIEE